MPGRSKESKTIVPGIALRLRTLIWKGELQPGEHLNQEAWASALGVSHIPFREAIRILEGEGLLKITANRGVTVTPVTAQEVQEWSLEFRGLMYALLPLAVRHATPASLARARALLPELDQPMVAPETHLEFWRSLFEPCGLTQLIGLKYGTVPIVRATGGLADTVFDANHSQKPPGERNGYVFNDFNPQGLESALQRAIGMWYSYPQQFRELAANGMRCDYSWNHPARHYLNVYDYIRDK